MHQITEEKDIVKNILSIPASARSLPYHKQLYCQKRIQASFGVGNREMSAATEFHPLFICNVVVSLSRLGMDRI